MDLIPLGDSALLVVFNAKPSMRTLDLVTRLTRRLNEARLAGVSDIVPSFTTLAVHYEPRVIAAGAGAGTPWERVVTWIKNMQTPSRGAKDEATREVEIPVCYGGEYGPDLASVASAAGMDEAAVVRLHVGAVYRVAAVGFSPGFPYLLGLPAKLTTPRRATPRVRVPEGSVAIGGSQSGIYPTATPGGWSLIGRTPLRLFRPEIEDAPTLLSAGDTVRFVNITHSAAVNRTEKPLPLAVKKPSKHARVFEVIKPGVFTTVQDLGRRGRQHLGITVGGAMDRVAARVANMLLGNDENAPLLEGTLTGPVLRILRDTWIAVTGAEAQGVPGWRPLKVRAGQVISLSRLTGGTRVYVAVAGGLDVPMVLGGTGTLVAAAIGGWHGRTLTAGDTLGGGLGDLTIKGEWHASPTLKAKSGAVVRVRFVRGPQWQWFEPESRRAFSTAPFKITPHSDRMGLRLAGPALRVGGVRELASEGVSFGTVQVPPDGNPIVLMADRQTIGGYPKIGDVISVDLPALAQVFPGSLVRFEEVSLDEAQELYLRRECEIALLGIGLQARVRLT